MKKEEVRDVVTLRLTKDEKWIIMKAASLYGDTFSTFLREQALDRAKAIIARTEEAQKAAHGEQLKLW